MIGQVLIRQRRIRLQFDPSSESGLRLDGIAAVHVGPGGHVARKREPGIAFREAHQLLPCKRGAFLARPGLRQGGGDHRGTWRRLQGLGQVLFGLVRVASCKLENARQKWGKCGVGICPRRRLDDALRRGPILLPHVHFERLSHLCEPAWPALARDGGEFATGRLRLGANLARRNRRGPQVASPGRQGSQGEQ